MNGFKKKVGHYMPIVFIVLVIFLFIHYWDNLVGLGLLCLNAGMSLIIGAVIAYIVNIPMMGFEKLFRRFDKKKRKTTKLRRLVSMLLAFIAIIAIIVLIVVVVGPQFVKSLVMVLTNAQEKVFEILRNLQHNEIFGKYAEQLMEMLPSGSDIGNTIAKLGSFLLNGASGAFSTIAESVSSIINGITETLIGIVFSMYILLDKEHLKRQFSGLIRVYVYKGESLIRIAHVLDENFHNYIVAQVLDAVILGTLCGIGMWILRFPYPILTGVIIAFTALIPIVGAFIGAAIAAFIIFTISPIKALFFIIYLLVLQQVDNKFIYPNVVGSYVNLESLWVLVSITVGGSLFGVVGMLCGVPITATIYQLIKEDYSRRLREEKAKKDGDSSKNDNSENESEDNKSKEDAPENNKSKEDASEDNKSKEDAPEDNKSKEDAPEDNKSKEDESEENGNTGEASDREVNDRQESDNNRGRSDNGTNTSGKPAKDSSRRRRSNKK